MILCIYFLNADIGYWGTELYVRSRWPGSSREKLYRDRICVSWYGFHYCTYTYTSLLYIGPLRLYMETTLWDVPVTVLYPLLPNEVYLPECHEDDVSLVALVCLRFNIVDSAPRLTVAESANNTIAWNNTLYSAIGNFQNFLTQGTFSCSTTQGHVVSTLIARGEFE